MKQARIRASIDVKKKIEDIVINYKKLFKIEYKNFLRSVAPKRDLSKFGELKGTDVILRQVCEYPETLYVMIYKSLSPEEYQWFQKTEALNWFAKKFPEFRVSQKV
jgi:hypothetical protein